MLILTNQKDGNSTTPLHAVPYGSATEIVEFVAESPNDAGQFKLMMHMTNGDEVSLGTFSDNASMKAALGKIDKIVDFTYYPNPKK